MLICAKSRIQSQLWEEGTFFPCPSSTLPGARAPGARAPGPRNKQREAGPHVSQTQAEQAGLPKEQIREDMRH